MAIMLTTRLGRECLELPAELLFSDLDIEVLQTSAKKRESPSQPGSAMQCVL